MAEAVLERPDLAVTINVVPSLLEQLAAAAPGVGDPEWTSRAPRPDSLDDAARATLLTRLTIVPTWARTRFPRFAVARRTGILRRRGARLARAPRARVDRSDALRASVARVDRGARRGRRVARRRGRRRAASPPRTRCSREVVPRLRALVAAGPRAEVSVTPDVPSDPAAPRRHRGRRAARCRTCRCRRTLRHPEDAYAQLAASRRCAETVFGRAATGLWPSEGSVSPEVAALAGTRGLSLARHRRRGALPLEGPRASGRVGARATVAGGGGGAAPVLPRPRALGQGGLRVLEVAGGGRGRRRHDAHLRTARRVEGPGPARLFIALDGENCWEYYPDDGHDFIERLYDALEATPWLTTTTPSRVLAEAGPRGDVPGVGHIDALHSGSWIEANYRIWIGHPEKNAAWDALAKTRAMVGEAFGAGRSTRRRVLGRQGRGVGRRPGRCAAGERCRAPAPGVAARDDRRRQRLVLVVRGRSLHRRQGAVRSPAPRAHGARLRARGPRRAAGAVDRDRERSGDRGARGARARSRPTSADGSRITTSGTARASGARRGPAARCTAGGASRRSATASTTRRCSCASTSTLRKIHCVSRSTSTHRRRCTSRSHTARRSMPAPRCRRPGTPSPKSRSRWSRWERAPASACAGSCSCAKASTSSSAPRGPAARGRDPGAGLRSEALVGLEFRIANGTTA